MSFARSRRDFLVQSSALVALSSASLIRPSWAQSAPIADRGSLEARFAEAETRFASQSVPRPPNWGGVRVAAQRVEFWQGRASRLHDRLVWTREGSGWTIGRLAP